MADKKKKNEEVENDLVDTMEETTQSKELEYLELAQRIKAEFENYKRRNAEVTVQSFENGVAKAIEKLLPAMDSFKQAKSSIQDENTLKEIIHELSDITGIEVSSEKENKIIKTIIKNLITL